MTERHEVAERLTEALFTSRITPDELDRLMEHLRSCQDCSARFERVRAAGRLDGAGREPPAMSRHEADLLKRVLVERVTSRRGRWSEAWRRVARGAWLPAAALAATLVVAAIGLRGQGGQGSLAERRGASDELTAKGASAQGAPSLVRVLCMTPGASSGRGVEPLSLGGEVPGGRAPHVRDDRSLPPAAVAALPPSDEPPLLTRQREPRPQQLFEGYLSLRAPGRVAVVAVGTQRPLPDDALLAYARGIARGDAEAPERPASVFWVEVVQ